MPKREEKAKGMSQKNKDSQMQISLGLHNSQIQEIHSPTPSKRQQYQLVPSQKGASGLSPNIR